MLRDSDIFPLERGGERRHATGADFKEYIDAVGGGSGEDGDSAYEVAVANGFVGTEAEWLASLVGAPGAAGTDGVNGQGVPTGGTVGQVLTKVDGADYNTNWVTPSGSGSVVWGGVTGTLSDQTDLQSALDGKQAVGSYAAAVHTHVIGDVTGLQAALDAKLDSAGVSAFGATLIDDGSASAARTTLGLGTAATSATGDFTAASHDGATGSAHGVATGSVNGFMSSADKSKLDGVSSGATANSSDAILLSRANHTGTQTASTISDFASAVSSNTAVAANTAKISNATHTGDVTGSTALTIADDVVSNAKLSNVATGTIKGRSSGGTGDPEDLTGTEATALLDEVTSGAKGLAPASGGGTTNFLRADGAWAAPAGGGGGSGPTILVYATSADADKTNDASYAAEPDLVTDTLEANSVYRLEMTIGHSSDAAEDFQCRLTRTGLSDADLYYSSDLDNTAQIASQWDSGQEFNGSGVASPRFAHFLGTVVTGTNTGNINFEWRQRTAGAGTSRLRAGSHIILTKLS